MRKPIFDPGRRSLLTGRLDEIRAAEPPPAEVHVVSLVVYSDPSRLAEVSAAVGRLPGAEVHASDGGKLVVVVETGGDADMAAAIQRVDRTAGVICTALVYQQAELLGPDD